MRPPRQPLWQGFAPLVPWAAGDGALDLLAQVGLVFLWPLLPVLKYGPDPVVWLAVGIALALRTTALYQYVRLTVLRACVAGRVCRVG